MLIFVQREQELSCGVETHDLYFVSEIHGWNLKKGIKMKPVRKFNKVGYCIILPIDVWNQSPDIQYPFFNIMI